MIKVYMVEGWFGSDEWNEKCFATLEAAEVYCAKLWETRVSPRLSEDHYCQGVCKFAVEEYEVHDH